jgi:hypothetical protein
MKRTTIHKTRQQTSPGYISFLFEKLETISELYIRADDENKQYYCTLEINEF